MLFINCMTLLGQNKTLQLIDNIKCDDRVTVHSELIQLYQLIYHQDFYSHVEEILRNYLPNIM